MRRASIWRATGSHVITRTAQPFHPAHRRQAGVRRRPAATGAAAGRRRRVAGPAPRCRNVCAGWRFRRCSPPTRRHCRRWRHAPCPRLRPVFQNKPESTCWRVAPMSPPAAGASRPRTHRNRCGSRQLLPGYLAAGAGRTVFDRAGQTAAGWLGHASNRCGAEPAAVQFHCAMRATAPRERRWMNPWPRTTTVVAAARGAAAMAAQRVGTTATQQSLRERSRQAADALLASARARVNGGLARRGPELAARSQVLDAGIAGADPIRTSGRRHPADAGAGRRL